VDLLLGTKPAAMIEILRALGFDLKFDCISHSWTCGVVEDQGYGESGRLLACQEAEHQDPGAEAYPQRKTNTH
jgi:hypothetical protein